jgi:hypothetical protein
MNEATFEARLNTCLQNLFPAVEPLRIKHQRIFNLHLGHHHVTIDGEPKTAVGGRLDVLILVDEIPVLLLELKSPEVQILDEDRDQGISYARLMDKMPPLVVISNGTETRFYNSYNKQPWHGSTISEETIKQLLQHALACAVADRDEAVRLLLGYKPEIWATIIKQTTEASLRDITGSIADWSHPLSEGFSIPRRMANDIEAIIGKDDRVLLLAGPPLSGKTNVLYQFCRDADHSRLIPFYIEGTLVKFGLFQYLANVFSKTLLRATPVEQIRQWLIVSLRGSPDRRLVFVIDGGISSADDTLAVDLNELLSLLDSANASVVLALNDSLVSDLTDVPGRTTKTLLGRKARILNLSPLTDSEFPQALEYFAQKCSGIFHSGVYNSKAFRHPGLLRVCAAYFLSDPISTRPEGKGSLGIIPGVPSLQIPHIAWDVFAVSPQLRDDLRRLARAFIADEQIRRNGGPLAVLAHNTGIMTIQTAEGVLGEERLDRLRSQGYIRFANGPSATTLCIPTLPEALSAAAAYEVGAGFESVMAEKGFDAACEYLLQKSEPFPYGDIVGAMAIIDIVSRSEKLLYRIVHSLLERRPIWEHMSNEATLGIPSAKFGEIRMHIMDKSGQSLGGLMSNTHAWLVLSHLATCPMIDDEGSWAPYLRLIGRIGSWQNLLFRPDFMFIEDSKGIHVHDIGESGTVVCPNGGIVEPITLAMQLGFYNLPDEMLGLCRYAAKNNDVYLTYRLLAASYSVQSCTEERVAAAAAQARDILHPVTELDIETRCRQFAGKGHRSEGRSPKKKIGRNEKCPCNSGLKYKNCCGR